MKAKNIQNVAILAAKYISAAGTVNGTGVNVMDYEGEVKFTLDSSAGGAGNTLSVKLQHSADNSTFTDITGGAFTQVGNAAGFESITLNSNGLKKYVRGVDVAAGASLTFARSLTMTGMKKYN